MDEPDATPGDAALLATYRSAPIATGRPTRVRIYKGHIEFDQFVDPVRRNVQRARYDQIAQVYTHKGLFFADLVVETRGGGALRAPGMSKAEAVAASDLILSHM